MTPKRNNHENLRIFRTIMKNTYLCVTVKEALRGKDIVLNTLFYKEQRLQINDLTPTKNIKKKTHNIHPKKQKREDNKKEQASVNEVCGECHTLERTEKVKCWSFGKTNKID